MSNAARAHRSPQSAPAPASSAAPSGEEQSTTWPHGASHEPVMKIGELVEQLRPAFPALSISKVRYLETEGLISPHRLGNGYRRYSAADVERLRFALTAQRDEYLPLSVIRERLEEMDASPASAAPAPRVVALDGAIVDEAVLDRDALVERAGVSEADFEEILAAGLIKPDDDGYFPASAIRVVRTAMEVHVQGVALRNLRAVRSAAQREADMIVQATSLRKRRDAQAGEQAGTELAQTVSRLHDLLLHRAVEASQN